MPCSFFDRDGFFMKPELSPGLASFLAGGSTSFYLAVELKSAGAVDGSSINIVSAGFLAQF